MADITDLPVNSASDAASIGFAVFNDVPHKAIDIPDGDLTFTARTGEGRRVTFYFGPQRQGGPARIIDVAFHERGTSIPNADNGVLPTFNFFGITIGGRHIVDTRVLPTRRFPDQSQNEWDGTCAGSTISKPAPQRWTPVSLTPQSANKTF